MSQNDQSLTNARYKELFPIESFPIPSHANRRADAMVEEEEAAPSSF
jgi:hypothetical protein